MNTNLFASANLTAGQLNAIVKKLGGHEAALKFLRGELNKWREQDDVIYFSVTSDGTTGAEWISRLKSKGIEICDYAKHILYYKGFNPSSGITYEIAVLKGKIFRIEDSINSKIFKEAKKRKLTKPNFEIACLMREKFSDKELDDMGLDFLVTMHKPLIDPTGGNGSLYGLRFGIGSYLHASFFHSDDHWPTRTGFAFVVSQTTLTTL